MYLITYDFYYFLTPSGVCNISVRIFKLYLSMLKVVPLCLWGVLSNINWTPSQKLVLVQKAKKQ